jgi:hypothetical protein
MRNPRRQPGDDIGNDVRLLNRYRAAGGSLMARLSFTHQPQCEKYLAGHSLVLGPGAEFRCRCDCVLLVAGEPWQGDE